MATYKEIKGVTIQTRSEDPVVGGVPGGTWASGGTMNTARSQGATCLVGIQTAAIFIAGENPGPSNVALVESYDGSSFTEIADVNTARRIAGASGVQTAALFFGGYTSGNVGNTESWNGSSWTEVNDLNSARRSMGGSGTYTAALCAGGGNASGAETETWDGSSWTEVADLNEGRSAAPAVGTQTASIIIGEAPNGALVEQWDGSSWTEVGDLNTGRYGAAGGLYNSALLFQGTNGTRQTLTEFWDGTSWTEVADTSEAKQDVSGAGASSSAALSAGGYITNFSATSEEFSTAPVTAAILTEGSIFLSGGTTLKGFGKAAGIPATVWSSGGNLNTARHGGGSAGIQTAALCSGGGNPSAVAVTEQYNGSAWTEVNDLNSGRKTSWNGLGLSYSAAIFSSGSQPPGTTRVANNESWNGSTWTEVNNVNTARNNAASSGSQTSGIGSGGYPAPSYTNATETWDGTSWTETSDLNTSRYVSTGAGQSSSSALNIGGYSSTYLAVVEQWDGSAWTEVSDLNTARYSGASSIAGPIDQVLFFGGDSSNPTPTETRTELWNGSSWTELNDLSTARWELYGAGTGGASALAYGGSPGPSAATEEWTSDNGLADISFDQT